MVSSALSLGLIISLTWTAHIGTLELIYCYGLASETSLIVLELAGSRAESQRHVAH